jgi:hypothetical protein
MLDPERIRPYLWGVKTTIELPNELLHRAKASAVGKGKTLKAFFSEAVAAKLQAEGDIPECEKPWMKGFGALEDLKEESAGIMEMIEKEFRQVDEQGWGQ